MAHHTVVSIITPVFNEQKTLPIFYDRLDKAISLIDKEKYSFEIIFTDNGSQDTTRELIRNLKLNDNRIKLVALSRNFGYQLSLMSGLSKAKGDLIIFIDVDCEDPPEMIPQFLKGHEDGYDIVYGRRDSRPEPKWIQSSRKIFYRLTKFVADYDFVLDMAEFSLFNRKVANIILQSKSDHPFIRAEIGFCGFKRLAIPYTRQLRVAGETHYNLIGMTKFAVAGILSSSTLPLRMGFYFAIPLIVLNIASFIYSYFFNGVNYYYLFSNLFNQLFMIIMISFIGIYIARTYKNTLGRSPYIINESESILD